jgi:ATP-dependent helicase/DNAse subunit B
MPTRRRGAGVGGVREDGAVPITLVTGPANAGKAQVVLDAVRRHLAHGEEPLLVLPTRADAEHYLHELAGEGAAMGVLAQPFGGLIARAVALAGISEPLLDGLARQRLLAALARERGVRAGAGFVEALGELIADLQLRRVAPAQLRRALASWAAADGAHAAAEQLAHLYEAYLRALARAGCIDGEQRAMRALDELRRRPALWGERPALFYGFDDLTPVQVDAIETLGVLAGAAVTVALAYEPGRTAFAGRAASFHALRPLAAEHVALPARAEYYSPPARPALAHLERSLFEPDTPRIAPDGAVRLLEGGGERAELELVAAEIGELLAQGMPAEEIAIALRLSPPRAQLLAEVLSDAGVPFALRARMPLADTGIGRALLGLLRAVPAAGAGGEAPAGSARDLLAWLRAPGVLRRPERADRFEIMLRRAGVESAAEASVRWRREHWPLGASERLAAAAELPAQARAGALIARAERELRRLFVAPHSGDAHVFDVEESAEAGAFVAARNALEELRELARRAPESAPATPWELARALEQVTFEAGARPRSGAISVLDPLALRARRVRALFVCALQEGEFPAPARAQPFLSADERARLATVAGLRIGDARDQLAAERYLFYALASRPEERLYLSWHVADDEGEPTARSLFVDDVCDLFDERLHEGRAQRPLGAVPLASAGAARERELAGSRAGPRARAERGFGLRDEQLLVGLRERVWSASSLEAWRSCPMRWFVERMLAPASIDPEAEPLARGAVAHQALKDTLEGLRARTGSARVTVERLPLARELLRAALAAAERDRALTVAAERLPGARRRLQADLERFLEAAAGYPSPLEPVHLELGFGFEPGEDPDEGAVGAERALPAVELGVGVRLRGRIDRVDVDARGRAIVYDYKNRQAPAPGRWVSDGNLQVALYMRAVEQLLELDVVGGFYQPLSGESLRARGVLEQESGLELECTRGDERPREELEELRGELLALALAAAAEAGRGELAPRPRTCGWNESGCQYPTICRCER